MLKNRFEHMRGDVIGINEEIIVRIKGESVRTCVWRGDFLIQYL